MLILCGFILKCFELLSNRIIFVTYIFYLFLMRLYTVKSKPQLNSKKISTLKPFPILKSNLILKHNLSFGVYLQCTLASLKQNEKLNPIKSLLMQL